MKHGMIYDGVELGVWLECNMARPLVPPVAVETESVPGRDGAVVRSVALGPLTIAVSARLKRSSRPVSELRHEIAAALFKTEPKKLQLPDDPLYHYAVLSGETELDRLFERGKAELTFLCPDPVAYGAERSLAVPSGGSLAFVVGGTYPTRPLIRAAAAVRNASSEIWGVRLDDGDFIHVATGTPQASTVAIDCGERTCRVNGATSLPTLDSDWLELGPGEHVIAADGGTGAFEVEFAERWL